jgi:hypothetical protein
LICKGLSGFNVLNRSFMITPSPVPRLHRHPLEWKLMAVSLSMLGGAAWYAAHLSPIEPANSGIVSPMAVSPPSVLGAGTGTQEIPFGGNIRFSDSTRTLATQVALKEEK